MSRYCYSQISGTINRLGKPSQEAGERGAGGKGEVVTDLVLRPIENARFWAGLDTHVPLCFTASGLSIAPPANSPLPLRLFGQANQKVIITVSVLSQPDLEVPDLKTLAASTVG